MRPPALTAAAVILTLLAAPAAADGPRFLGVLPPAPRLEQRASAPLMAVLVQAVVIGQNCPTHSTTDGEWALLTGSSDRIAAVLGLDATSEDDRFWRPAFAALDAPDGCARHGWTVPKALGFLRGLGGRSGD